MSADTIEVLVSLLLLGPLAGAVVLLLLGKRIGEPGAGELPSPQPRTAAASTSVGNSPRIGGVYPTPEPIEAVRR